MEWLPVLPFIVVLILALTTKQVIPSLFAGVVVAAYIDTPNLIGGLESLLYYFTSAFHDGSNLKIIWFLYLFSAVVGLMKISGGIKGFVKIASERITTRRSAIFLTWISALATFSAPSFRIVTITPVMRALLKKLPMSRQELGFVIETTATPVIVLIPLATAFVGYMTSVIELSIHQAEITGDSYRLFLTSIPFNFFAFLMILLGVYYSIFHKTPHPPLSEKEEENEHNEIPDEKTWEDCHPCVARNIPVKPWNLIFPIISIIGFTFLFMYILGVREGGEGLAIWIEANVLDAMVLALLLTLVGLALLLKFQGFTMSKMMKYIIEGGNDMMSVILLLTVIWALGEGSESLGFAQIISEAFAWIPPSFVGVIVFVLGCGLSYFIGSAWGTWGILMPIGVSIAGASGASLPFVIGAVFASGTFGSFASPLSDDTNTTAGILSLNSVEYAKFKWKPAIIAASLASGLYLLYPFIF
ncbi:Na+/H+ antiporter NhaC family protein [Evansella halocellulosilytica]|uniref:Na+/H+ antiporter NhaC family protein n=1 Tax=Evansella halocellulosilytica TaxID=2011013 RepID=UPI000BB8118B|nr:Na+/H+ antiporter NhaC family protein [Evansella halocellulosilytica]